MRIIGIHHKPWGFLEFASLLRTKQVARVVCDGRQIVIPIEGLCLPDSVAGITRRKTGYNRQIAVSKGLPGGAVVGKIDIASNLQNDESESKDIGWLVVLSQQDLRPNVLSVTFALDALGSWPWDCEPKVANLEIAVEPNKNVGRFQIQVNEASAVNSRKSLHQLISMLMLKIQNHFSLPGLAQAMSSKCGNHPSCRSVQPL